MNSEKAVLFEPWNLGDAVIAMAIALHNPRGFILACNPRWHQLLRIATAGMETPELLSINLGYIGRGKQSYFDFALDGVPETAMVTTVISPRGDARDYYAARRAFPGAKIRMTGWWSFLAQRSAVIDIPFSTGVLPVLNRYRAWATLANIDWARVESFYRAKRPAATGSPIVIHVGSQWRSRQYPFVTEITRVLQESYGVILVAGPKDALPDGVSEREVRRVADGDLVTLLASSRLVIANDSGPMHLAALLRCRTLVVSRQAAIRQWLPPLAVVVESPLAPRGYKALPNCDEIWSGWPEPQEVAERIAEYMASSD